MRARLLARLLARRFVRRTTSGAPGPAGAALAVPYASRSVRLHVIARPLALWFELRFPWIDPVLVDLPGPIDLRWYGAMYGVGFAIAFLVLRWLARRGELRLEPSAVGDLVAVSALGVIVGGRLGYLLFYGLGDAIAHPLEALRIWEGGMSFHGGLLGVTVAALWFARRRRLPFLNLADAAALAAPFGIAAVRVANFINGELYGRLASPGVPWAMRFPTDPVALRLLGAAGLTLRERELRIGAAYASGQWEAIRPLVPLRHPSQLYEALAEGVLLASVLWLLHAGRARRTTSGPTTRSGLYAGTFLVGYAIARITIEQFRQPDAQFQRPGNPLGTVLGPLTMGQVLSGVMLLVGLGLLVYVAGPSVARRRGQSPRSGEERRE